LRQSAHRPTIIRFVFLPDHLSIIIFAVPFRGRAVTPGPIQKEEKR
jgi:hypothetical protein